MAYIQARKNKEGRITSFTIKVHKGTDLTTGKELKPYITSYKPPPEWSKIKAQKEAEKYAILFEQQCKIGLTSDNKQTFKVYANYVLELKKRNGIKRKTLERYKSLLVRIIPELGHLKLIDIKPSHLNNLYEKLSRDGENKRNKGRLSNKTIIEHHRLISTILQQANKEMLIPFNTATRATPPKLLKTTVNYLQVEDIIKIRECLIDEPIKWKAMINLMIVSGVRRGELLGLKWNKIDFNANKIFIDNNLQYSSDIGIYEDTTKTDNSNREIVIPSAIMDLLREYKLWYKEQKSLYGSKWVDSNYVFVSENGSPMHPDTPLSFLKRFSKRHNLPHINPHAFRHTMASLLFYEGLDSITVSKRLGHAKVSTTTDIYAHIINQADEKASNVLENILQSHKA